MPHASQTGHERKLATKSKLMGPISSQPPVRETLPAFLMVVNSSRETSQVVFRTLVKRLRFHISSLSR
jgi:hypothetical protein